MRGSRSLALSAICFLALASSPSAAEAKVPIPCTGDRLVKVVDISAEKQPPGVSVGLGYLFPGCFETGEWIGYTGPTGSYIKLDESGLKRLLAMAGLSEPPPEPSRWHFPREALFVELMVAALFALLMLWQLCLGGFGRK